MPIESDFEDFTDPVGLEANRVDGRFEYGPPADELVHASRTSRGLKWFNVDFPKSDTGAPW